MIRGKLIRCLSMVICLVLTASLFSPFKVSANGDEYDMLRQRWVELITGGTEIDLSDPLITEQINLITETANSHFNSMDKRANRTYLWSNYAGTTSSAYVTAAFGRIYEMALAYSTTGCSLNGDEAFLNEIISAFSWMEANRYNSGTTKYDNWWDWEIGVPRHVNNIIALLYDELPQALKDKYYAALQYFIPDSKFSDASYTAANKVWIGNIGLVHGILSKNNNRITAARNSFSPVFAYVTKNDGFYEDGSFLQHGSIAYTGGYGIALITELSKIMLLLNNSSWDFVSNTKNNVYKWIYDSFEPLIYKGGLMDMVIGREIARADVNLHTKGRGVIQALILMSQYAPEADKDNYKNMITRWITDNTYSDFFSNNSIYYISKGKELLSTGTYSENSSMVKIFPSMDRAVMQRPDFAFGIAMHSKDRTQSFEVMNNENKRGWYTGAGTSYLYNDDLAQFADGFWPTVDSYKLPGVSSNTSKVIYGYPNGYNKSNFAGGVSLDNMYGAVGFKFEPTAYTNLSKKSYFMFDDEIVFLGNVSANEPAITTVENRKINGSNTFTVDDAPKNTSAGVEATSVNPKWAHLEGNVPNSDIGYYFPEDCELKSLREVRTDKWTSINSNASYSSYTNNITRSYLSMWFNHGTTSSNSPYAYVMIPNKSVAETKSYATTPGVAIDTHNDKVHAAKEVNLGITAANFWENEVAQSSDLRCDKAASVIMRQTGNELTVSLSDPTMETSGAVILEIGRKGLDVISKDDNVSIMSLSPTIKVAVDVTGKRGLGTDMKFTLSNPNPVLFPPYVYEEPPVKPVNIAPQATLAVDSTTNYLHEKENMVDGVKDSNASRWMSNGQPQQRLITMTWAEPQTINNVKIWSGDMDAADRHLGAFRIECWNGANWYTVATVENNDKDGYNGDYNDISFEPETTTRVRIFITKPNQITNETGNALNYARVFEVEVWTCDPPPPPPPMPKNIAPQATLAVDSTTNYLHEKENMVDGVKDSNASRWMSNGQPQQRLITMTWAEPQTINNVKIWSGDMEAADRHLGAFRIECWNGANWYTVATVENNDKDGYNGDYNDISFETEITTRVRIFITKPNQITNETGNALNYARVFEVEVWTYCSPYLLTLAVANNTVTRNKSTNTLAGTVSLSIEKDSADYGTATAILAVYNSSGVLAGTYLKPITDLDSQVLFNNILVGGIYDDNYEIKAFVFDGTERLVPIAEFIRVDE